MGWIADFKAKRAAKAALNEHNRLHDIWQEDLDTLKKLITVGGGIRFRVGAMKGQVIPGEELQVDKDQGVVMLTTERLIFTGPIKTQEWNFDKLLQLSTNDDESDYFISVSNRQKTSGVRFSPTTGREFNRFLGSATAAHEHGIDALLKELHAIEKRIYEEEPKLTQPSEQSSLQ